MEWTDAVVFVAAVCAVSFKVTHVACRNARIPVSTLAVPITGTLELTVGTVAIGFVTPIIAVFAPVAYT